MADTHAARIYVRLDDAGLCPESTLGALDLLRLGVAKNVSIMVPPCLATDSDQQALRALCGWVVEQQDVAVGLHVVLNCEWPDMRFSPAAGATHVSSLVDDAGYLPRLPEAYRERVVDPVDVMRELSAQLTWLQRVGFTVNYIDEHMGVGWANPSIRDAVRAFAAEQQLALADDLPRPASAVHQALTTAAAMGSAGGRDLAGALRALVCGEEDTMVILHPMRDLGPSLGSPTVCIPAAVARQRNTERLAWSSTQVIDLFHSQAASVAIAHRTGSGR